MTIDEKAFEGVGIFLLGAVLDRFFAQYSALNHFTQTVVRSVERGEIMPMATAYGLATAGIDIGKGDHGVSGQT